MNVLSRPKLRGVIHLIMSPLALVAGLTLITITSELRGRITLTIFTLTAVSLFTCSAIYHRVLGARLQKQYGAALITQIFRY